MPIERVVVDEARHPDRDRTYVLDHLIDHYRVAGTIPPVHATVRGGMLVVVRAHKYLAVAHALGRPVVRAIVDARSGPTAVAAWPGVAAVDVAATLRREREQPRYLQWHLIVFEAPLPAAAREGVEAAVRAFFAGLSVRAGNGLYQPEALAFAPEGDRLRFAVPVLDGDDSWYGDHLRLLRGIDRDTAPIASFSGHRLP
ncbi:hypothetical protein ACPPVO_20810 [Dactylosporangium sp. McL0621]|uniref:hypothetical protein n=1 Tax=Dactylosporangium sp. McL0621 TaxID=3415678 RepID=UPI003CEA9541